MGSTVVSIIDLHPQASTPWEEVRHAVSVRHTASLVAQFIPQQPERSISNLRNISCLRYLCVARFAIRHHVKASTDSRAESGTAGSIRLAAESNLPCRTNKSSQRSWNLGSVVRALSCVTSLESGLFSLHVRIDPLAVI